MKRCSTQSLRRIERKISQSLPCLSSDNQFTDMYYYFTLHTAHPDLIYPNYQLLGGLKQIFTKEYPMQSTIFGPHYQHQAVIFVSRWSYHQTYVGQRLQMKSRQQLEIFQSYLSMKYSIPKIKHMIIPETFTQYMNILSNFKNQQLKKDPIFLNFVGVTGDIATFDLQKVPITGMAHKIYKNQYIYYQRQVHHHNQQHCLNIIRRCLKLRDEDESFYLKLNSETLVLYNKDSSDRLQIVETLVLSSELQVRFRVESVTEYFNMKISNGINFIFIAFETFFDMIHFVTALNLCLDDSGYLEKNRYFSFSIQREDCLSKYYIDGERYFFDLSEALKKATREVCITDWMLTPYLLLRRPDDLQHGRSRLDNILFSLADQKHVEIFILIYSQPMMMFHDSQYVQEYFQKNRRIHVIRHPDTVFPILWSHHQKMCIIDQKIAFMGGLDITYGRWDTSQHCVVDCADYWPGRDYRNDRLKEVTQPRKFSIPDLDRDNDPRMPWHDIGIQIQGKSVIDLKRHFTQYWYFALKDLTKPRQFFIDQLQYKLRDAMAMAQQNLQKDVQYFTTDEQLKYYEKRLKKTESEIKKIQKKQKTSKFRITIGVSLRTYYTLTIRGLYDYSHIAKDTQHKVKHHLLRSSSNWSMGIVQHIQQSIHFGYIQLIRNAKEFIYIENQFFMGIQHKVIDTIVQRIDRAFKNKENFKIIVMLPLLPGFPGQVNSSEAAVMKIQLHWQYQAIIRGKKSIFKRLAYITDLSNYIAFLGLRNHAMTPKQARPVTEIIYIHSKMMIVDDKYVLIGSANINDRSMLGSRDSEIAIITEDQNMKSITDFRAKLFEEHFDLTHHEAVKFLDSSKRQRIWNKILEIAKNNTLIYRQIFACYPDDTYSTFSDIQTNYKTEVQKVIYDTLKDEIRGHVVQNPLQFLQKEELTFQPLQLESFAPMKTFT